MEDAKNFENHRVASAMEIISSGLEKAQKSGMFTLQEAYSLAVSIMCINEFIGSKTTENMDSTSGNDFDGEK